MAGTDVHRIEAVDTAAVVVNYRTPELTREAVVSVLCEPEVDEVVVVDNASGDGSVKYLRRAFAGERVRVLDSDRNAGFGPGVNLGAATCTATLLLILNSDAVVVAGSVAHLARVLLEDDRVGVVAPAIYDADGVTLQRGSFGELPSRRQLLSNAWARPAGGRDGGDEAPGWVSGVAMLLRRADFVALGGFDERFEMYFEDLDLCRRLREMGGTVRREPSAAVVHRRGQSSTSRRDQRRRFHESRRRYFANLGASRLELRCASLAGLIRTSLIRDRP